MHVSNSKKLTQGTRSSIKENIPGADVGFMFFYECKHVSNGWTFLCTFHIALEGHGSTMALLFFNNGVSLIKRTLLAFSFILIHRFKRSAVRRIRCTDRWRLWCAYWCVRSYYQFCAGLSKRKYLPSTGLIELIGSSWFVVFAGVLLVLVLLMVWYLLITQGDRCWMCCIEFWSWVFLCCVLWQSWQRSKENTPYVDSTQINTNSYKNNQVQAQSIFNEWMIVWILHIIINLNRG